jgi:phosphohistidine phosphatase
MDSDAFTTNARDLQEAAILQARLSAAAAADAAPKNTTPGSKIDDEAIPAVSIDEGAYKYVLVSAVPPPSSSGLERSTRLFVYSKWNAKYHVNVAEYLVPQLESSGYTDIQIKGGGRILRDDGDKRIHIFGYSYGFGMADHASAKGVVGRCAKYQDYEVTW